MPALQVRRNMKLVREYFPESDRIRVVLTKCKTESVAECHRFLLKNVITRIDGVVSEIPG